MEDELFHYMIHIDKWNKTKQKTSHEKKLLWNVYLKSYFFSFYISIILWFNHNIRHNYIFYIVEPTYIDMLSKGKEQLYQYIAILINKNTKMRESTTNEDK